MPISVTSPRGELTPIGEREIIPRLTEALLDATDARGNAFITSIIGGTLLQLAREDVYAGGANRPLVLIELTLPPVALTGLETRAAFIASATDVVDRLTVDDHRREDTWINVVHAADGGWGIGGEAFTGEDLLARA